MRTKADKGGGGSKTGFFADVLYGRLHTTRADYNHSIIIRTVGPLRYKKVDPPD